MTTNAKTMTDQLPALELILLFVWTILMVSPALKIEVLPRIQWIATFLLLPYPCYKAWQSQQLSIHYPYLIASGIFVLGILLSALFSQLPGYSIAEGIKVSLLLASVLLLTSDIRYLYVIWGAFIAAMLINFLLIMTALYQTSILASLWTIPARWMTLLAWPGSLAKVAIPVFAYYFYLTLCSNKHYLARCLIILISVMIVVLDNSRLAILSIGVGYFLIIGLALITQHLPLNKKLFAKIIVPLAAICLGHVLANQFSNFILMHNKQATIVPHGSLTLMPLQQQRAAATTPYETSIYAAHSYRLTKPMKRENYSHLQNENIYKTISGISALRHHQFSQTLQRIDAIRYVQYRFAFQFFQHEFLNWRRYIGRILFGNGMDAMAVSVHTSLQGKPILVSITNNYLDLFGKTGGVGLLGFILLSVCWVVYLPSSLKKIQCLAHPKDQAIAVASLFLLVYFILFALTSEFSTEFSEWIYYLVAAATGLAVLNNQFESLDKMNL